jgi:hypothetical protein
MIRMKKYAGAAAFLSAVIPGLGNFYLGVQRGSGIAYILAGIFLIYLASFNNTLYILYLILVVVAVHDAYTLAKVKETKAPRPKPKIMQRSE